MSPSAPWRITTWNQLPLSLETSSRPTWKCHSDQSEVWPIRVTSLLWTRRLGCLLLGIGRHQWIYRHSYGVYTEVYRAHYYHQINPFFFFPSHKPWINNTVRASLLTQDRTFTTGCKERRKGHIITSVSKKGVKGKDEGQLSGHDTSSVWQRLHLLPYLKA